MSLDSVVEAVGKAVDVAGIAIIVGGAATASVLFLDRARREGVSGAYPTYRRSLGRAILLGLEFLVAADIVRTVAITPTFSDVGVLGGDRANPHVPERRPPGRDGGSLALATSRGPADPRVGDLRDEP